MYVPFLIHDVGGRLRAGAAVLVQSGDLDAARVALDRARAALDRDLATASPLDRELIDAVARDLRQACGRARRLSDEDAAPVRR